MSALLPQAKSRHEKITQSLHSGHNIIRVCIPSYHIADDVVVYEVDCQNKKLRWNLWLRFEFFSILHQMMQELVTELSTPENRILLPPFPEKRLKLFTDHFNKHFIENRRMLLDNYVQKILANRYLRHSEIFISFLTPSDDEELDQNISNNDDNDDDNDPNINTNTSSSSTIPQQLNKPPPPPQVTNNNNNNAVVDDNNDDNDDDDKVADDDPTIANVNNLSPNDADTSQAIINKFISLTPVVFKDVNQDDEVTGLSIPQAQVLKHDHTIYQIHVENNNILDDNHSKWTVLKRFTDFSEFDTKIRKAITNDYPNETHVLPPLPPKYLKILVDHLDQTFIEKRRLLLQCYLQRLCQHRLLRRHDYTLQFLGVFK